MEHNRYVIVSNTYQGILSVSVGTDIDAVIECVLHRITNTSKDNLLCNILQIVKSVRSMLIANGKYLTIENGQLVNYNLFNHKINRSDDQTIKWFVVIVHKQGNVMNTCLNSSLQMAYQYVRRHTNKLLNTNTPLDSIITSFVKHNYWDTSFEGQFIRYEITNKTIDCS